MAKRVRTTWRKIKETKPKLYVALVESGGMTASQALRHLRRKGIKPILTTNELRRMATSASRRSNFPIRVTKDMTTGHRYADGVTFQRGTQVRIRIHPILKYKGKRYAKDVIEHEVDHAKEFRRSIKRRGNN